MNRFPKTKRLLIIQYGRLLTDTILIFSSNEVHMSILRRGKCEPLLFSLSSNIFSCSAFCKQIRQILMNRAAVTRATTFPRDAYQHHYFLPFYWLSASAVSTVLTYGAARAWNVGKPLEAKKKFSFLRECALFKRIYRVCKFDRLAWNLARRFPRQRTKKPCEGLPFFIIDLPQWPSS